MEVAFTQILPLFNIGSLPTHSVTLDVTVYVEDSHAGLRCTQEIFFTKSTGCIYKRCRDSAICKKVTGRGSREIQGKSTCSSSNNPHTRPVSLSDTHHMGNSPGSLYTEKRLLIQNH